MPASALGFETATWGRRALALFVDWIASTLVVIAAMGGLTAYSDSRSGSFIVLGVFVLESALFTATVGGSFGQLATRLRVVDVDGQGGHVALPKALARQILIAIVVPPLVFRPDGRGLHDLMAGSAVVLLDEWRRLTGRDGRTTRSGP